MNTTNIIKLIACLAWASVAVSSASPADASAITTQVGTFAACASQYTSTIQNHCPYVDAQEVFYGYQTAYKQQIKFVNTSCNTGGCTQDATDVYVDARYPVGRKVVTGSGPLCGAKYIYDLGSCEC
jgi:hypothetical protein